MRVFHRTRETLVLRDAPDALRMLGGFLAVAGLLPIAEALRTQSPSPGTSSVEHWVLLATGTLGLVAGGALLLLVRTTTCMVDRTAGTLRVTRRNALGTSGWGCYLSSITDIVLEPQFGADGHALYRMTLVSSSGRRIPLTSYSSAGVAAQMPAVAALRRFLPNAARGERTSVRLANLDRRQWRRVVGFLYWTAACLLLLGGGGAWMIWNEARASGAYRPVSATVLTTRVETNVRGGSVARRPVVVYRYIVDGRAYTSERVSRHDRWRAGNTAFEIVNQFAPGQRYTAFYDAANPATAFLFKPRDVGQYALVVAPLVGFLLLSRAIRSWRRRSPQEGPRPDAIASADTGLVFLPT